MTNYKSMLRWLFFFFFLSKRNTLQAIILLAEPFPSLPKKKKKKKKEASARCFPMGLWAVFLISFFLVIVTKTSLLAHPYSSFTSA